MKGQKIQDLSFSELEDIIIENFSKIGIRTDTTDEKLRKTCEAIFNYQPKILVDTIPVMFEMFAAGKIKVDKVKPDVNGYFFAQLKEGYFENAEVKKGSDRKKELKKLLADKGRTAYVRFMRYCEMYRNFPVSEDWVSILLYLVRECNYTLYTDFDNERLAIQEKTARGHVKKYAKKYFTNKIKIAA